MPPNLAHCQPGSASTHGCRDDSFEVTKTIRRNKTRYCEILCSLSAPYRSEKVRHRKSVDTNQTGIIFPDFSQLRQHCRASLGAEEVDSLFKLMSGNKNGRMMVYPVQAGREILHEAQTRTLEILSRAIDAAQAQPVSTPFSGTMFLDDDIEEIQPQPDVFDVMDNYRGQQRRPSALLEPDTTENAGLCEGSSPEGAKRPDSSGVEIGGIANDHAVDNETAAPLDNAPDGVTTRGRGRREFDVRKERAAERKTKNERLQKRRELDRLKRTQRDEQEKLGQKDELVLMQKEDERSEAVSRYIR